MNHLGLFEGIGGFSLPAHWMGWETKAWVEIDSFCQKILRKNFPNAKGYADIKEFDGKQWYGKIDILTGGFPCQPFSFAGKRKGNTDERALWPEMLRVIREVRPTWIVAENVIGVTSMENKSPISEWVQIGMESQNYFRRKYCRFIYRKRQSFVINEIIESLERENYSVTAFAIPASAVQAPHQRNRIWLIAHTNNILHQGGLDSSGSKKKATGNKKTNQRQRKTCHRERIRNELSHCNQNATNANDTRNRTQEHKINKGWEKEKQKRENFTQSKSSRHHHFGRNWYEVASELCRVDDGISKGLDKDRRERFKSLGNAVVTHVPFEIFKAIDVVINESQTTNTNTKNTHS